MTIEIPKTRYLNHSPKTVALVGMGPSIMDLATDTLTQEYDPAHADEVWGINMVANFIKPDVTFWLDDLEDQQNFRPKLFDALRKWSMPVITSKRYENILPNSYDFPIQEIGNIGIPVFGKPYLNNGVAMAVAYALWKGVKLMRIYGCDFTYPDRNYAESGRACVEAWITLAATRDMQVWLSPATSLLDTVRDNGVYGYKDQPPIVTPNGIFQYRKLAEATGPTATALYAATDSSGVSNAAVSGIAGDASGLNGAGRFDQKTADGHAAAAAG